MASRRAIRCLAQRRRRAALLLHSCRNIAFLVVVFQLLTGVLSTPATQEVYAAIESVRESRDDLNMPWEYGQVIYRINPESSRQLYIVGISHRDPSTGANGTTTVAAQKEIYRIGEWLKKSTQLDLLLPEGYFSETDCSDEFSNPVPADNDLAEYAVDNAQLEQELTAESFTNAEMLLMEHLGFRACQVEDKSIYRAVRSSLDKLGEAGSRHSDFQQAIEEMRYLQEIRTAQLLQDIPDIIEGQFEYGIIGKRSAMFTIGLNHIKHVFRYIENGSVDVPSTLKVNETLDLQQTTLNLLKTGYGISIILPRSLANNLQLLEKTQINQILLVQDNS